jgi:hypothetical protein
MDIRIEHIAYGPQHIYNIWCEGQIYTSFTCTPRLSWTQETDVRDLFEEALTYWSSPDTV